MSLPLFSCGTSRGGTTFFTRILSVNKQVKMASDPLLPLFRAFRNEIVLNKIDKDFDISQPLDDYYYYKNKLINSKVKDFVARLQDHELVEQIRLEPKYFRQSLEEISNH